MYKLFIRIKMRKDVVKEQIQWILLYIERGSVNVWKKNILKVLELGNLEYKTAKEFLADLKKEFRKGNKKSSKCSKIEEVRTRRKNNGKICSEV